MASELQGRHLRVTDWQYCQAPRIYFSQFFEKGTFSGRHVVNGGGLLPTPSSVLGAKALARSSVPASVTTRNFPFSTTKLSWNPLTQSVIDFSLKPCAFSSTSVWLTKACGVIDTIQPVPHLTEDESPFCDRRKPYIVKSPHYDIGSMSVFYPSTNETLQSSVSVEHNMSSSYSTSKDVTARILKKRESDRRCQRMKRERTKTKIAALEERVRSFGNQDPTGQVQSLMQQLQETERQRDDLAKKVKSIENVIRDADAEETDNYGTHVEQDNITSRHTSPSMAGSPGHDHVEPGTHSRGHEHKAKVLETSELGGPSNTSCNDGQYMQHNDSLAAHISSLSSETLDPSTTHIPPDLEAGGCSHASALHRQPCECCTLQSSTATGQQFNTWRFTNQVLSSRFKWPAYFQMLQDTYKDDTPVRAVVEGWKAIEARGPLHPSWHILKKIDQALFGRMGVTERLAVIYSTQLLLMSHTSPDVLPDVPQFYQKRPSQSLADSYAIHFFPWPGMRERFVFNQHRYCTNTFWNTFIDSLRLVWPFEFRDCYTRNLETGRYAISPQFRDRVNDIKCWAMDADIFNKWPELRVDIPAYNSIPPAVSNMIQRPKSLKKPSRANSIVACKTQARTANQSLQRTVSTQLYIPSDSVTLMPMYYQPSYYGMDGKTMPIGNWTESTSHQSPATMDYFASMSNPASLSDSF